LVTVVRICRGRRLNVATEHLNDPEYREHLEKLYAAIEYLKNLDLADLSPEDYIAIEESIIRIYVRKQVAKALDDVLRPAISELLASVERASALCREAMRHVDRVPSRTRTTTLLAEHHHE